LDNKPQAGADFAQKKTAVSAFISALLSGARSYVLYGAGNAAALQIVQRLVDTLHETIDKDASLLLDIHSNAVVFSGSELEHTPAATLFASNLYALNVRKMRMTKNLSPKGMAQLLALLVAKPDARTSLADLQKRAEAINVEGLQLFSASVFSRINKDAAEQRKPGKLREDEIAALLKTQSLRDRLFLLLYQNEILEGDEAAAITELLQEVLCGEISLDEFQGEMPWALYDPRIEENWKRLRETDTWRPKRRPRQELLKSDDFGGEIANRKADVGTLISALITGARTSLLFPAGHATLRTIAEKTMATLRNALGEQTSISLEIKPATVVVAGTELAPGPEITTFAAAFHSLGVGQILITDHLTPDGVSAFFKIMSAKPTEQVSLTDLQRQAKATVIDGLQMTFILEFVVAQKEGSAKTSAGLLSDEQVAALLHTQTLPDFLYLLLCRHETLPGKQAESITDLLEQVLYRQMSADEFQDEMPWADYDPRCKEHWTTLRACGQWRSKRAISGQPRARWDKQSLASWLGVLETAELSQLHPRQTLSKPEAVNQSLQRVLALLQGPLEENDLAVAVDAYARLLGELAQERDIERLIDEPDRWDRWAADARMKPLIERLRSRLCVRFQVPRLAESMVDYFLARSADITCIQTCARFISFVDKTLVPLLFDRLGHLHDDQQRQKVRKLLALAGRDIDPAPFVLALSSRNSNLVAAAINILTDLDAGANEHHVMPLLNHSQREVREAAMQSLIRAKTATATTALARHIAGLKDADEAGKAVIAASRSAMPGLDERLIEAFPMTRLYATQVAIATALGRMATRKSLSFVEKIARFNWHEFWAGTNKELRHAARESLKQLRRELTP